MSYQRTTTQDERVEQAIAFGRSWDWINEHLHATDAEIAKALMRIEAANLGPVVTRARRRAV